MPFLWTEFNNQYCHELKVYYWTEKYFIKNTYHTVNYRIYNIANNIINNAIAIYKGCVAVMN